MGRISTKKYPLLGHTWILHGVVSLPPLGVGRFDWSTTAYTRIPAVSQHIAPMSIAVTLHQPRML